jgi:hypothetical protein
MLRVGQKVVCVDASPVREDCTGHMPLRLEHGAIYTVREIHREPNLEGYGVRLAEMENSLVVWSDDTECEWSYDSRRFRPLETSEHKLEAAQSAE